MVNFPILFVDPTGETEYYYKGKWIGSDNIENGQITIIKSKELKKLITSKNSMFLAYTNLAKKHYGMTYENGLTSNEVNIDYKILKTADGILDKALKEGQFKEFGAVYRKNEHGKFQMTNEGIVEGPHRPFNGEKSGSVDLTTQEGDITIHSHRTGYDEVLGLSASSDEPSTADKSTFDSETMSIIAGKKRKSSSKYNNRKGHR